MSRFFARLIVSIALLHALLVGTALAAGYILPSGGEIAFVSERGDNRDIYTLDILHNLICNLTNSRRFEFSPVWSPDGSQIAFAAAPSWGADADLYIMDTNGQHMRILTAFVGNEVLPEWSPDGQQIAFTWNETGRSLLYVIDVNGDNLRAVGQTDSRVEVLSHTWSPDGSFLAYSGMSRGWDTNIVTVEGEFVQRVPIPGSLTQYDLDWSPDGQWLIFSSGFGGERSGSSADLYVVDLETGSQHTLTDGSAYNSYSSWSPDGAAIVYTSWRDGNPEIYLMNADGTNMRRLTYNNTTDVTPSWRP
jgi:Tol biopolymer transport system component